MKPRFSPKFALLLASLIFIAAAGVLVYRSINQSRAGVASGLNWVSGSHVANELGPNLEFGSWRGRPVDAIMVFTTRSSWSTIERPTNLFDGLGYKNYNGILVITQPLFPDVPGGAMNNGPTLASCAAGNFNANWRRHGDFLKQYGWNRPDLIIRLGPEFNGDWYHHAGTNVENFKRCYQNVYSSIKATAPNIRISWEMNGHGSQTCAGNAFNCYPGDGFVDIVGIDNYDHAPPSGSTEASWNSYCYINGQGICNVVNFARQHGKQLSVGEWGVNMQNPYYGGGDNPFYIRKMAELFNNNRDILAYEAYYNAARSVEPNNLWSGIFPKYSVDAPKASAEYLKWFGRNSPYVGQFGVLDNRIIVRPNGGGYYLKSKTVSPIPNPAVRNCITVRRGAGDWIPVSDATVNSYTTSSTFAYCNYEQEPSLNFVREDGNPYVWLVYPGGTKRHVGILCVPDAYTTPLKKFRVHVVPPGETAGHRDIGDFFGNPQVCGGIN